MISSVFFLFVTAFIGEIDWSATACTKLIPYSDSTPTRPFAAIIFKQREERGSIISRRGVPRAPYVGREAPLRSAPVKLREWLHDFPPTRETAS